VTSFANQVSGDPRTGHQPAVSFRKAIQRHIRAQTDNVDLSADVNAVVAANINEPGSSTHVSSKQRIVQRSGKTAVAGDETGQGGAQNDPPR